MQLTTPQQRILDFLKERAANHESPPTRREICKRFGYSSPKAAVDHLAALEKKGFLIQQRGRARGLLLVEQENGIPLIGQISAGIPRDVSQQTLGRLRIDTTSLGISKSAQAFALRVVGDSMIGRNIFDGDIVVIEQGRPPRNGDIVAALIDNESTLKVFVRRNGKIWLQAANERYADLMPTTDLNIQGVARTVIRFLN